MELPVELARTYGIAVAPDGPVPALASAGPLTIVNYFALQEVARYDDPSAAPCTGLEAMTRYAAVSGERLAAVGGRFLAQALGAKTLWGEDDLWDLVVVAAYPSSDALVALLRDDAYQAAFVHRRAAVARQRVTVSATLA